MNETGLWQKNIAPSTWRPWSPVTAPPYENYSRRLYPPSTPIISWTISRTSWCLRFADVLLMYSELTKSVGGINQVRACRVERYCCLYRWCPAQWTPLGTLLFEGSALVRPVALAHCWWRAHHTEWCVGTRQHGRKNDGYVWYQTACHRYRWLPADTADADEDLFWRCAQTECRMDWAIIFVPTAMEKWKNEEDIIQCHDIGRLLSACDPVQTTTPKGRQRERPATGCVHATTDGGNPDRHGQQTPRAWALLGLWPGRSTAECDIARCRISVNSLFCLQDFAMVGTATTRKSQ